MTDRIPLDELTSDALDQLYARAEKAEAELAGARATINHLSNAMSWIAGHDRQGLDHLEEAQYEGRSRFAAVKQAQCWAARARRAEAALAAFRDRVQAITDEARGGIRQQLGDALAALDEHQEQP